MVFRGGRLAAKVAGATCHLPCLQWPSTSSSPRSCYDSTHTVREKWKQVEDYWKPKMAQAKRKNEHGPKQYLLSMFPYPSGNLHMGHARVYTISDVLARFYKMKGYDVLHPMGWDAFGLPAENAAIERGLDPKQWTYSNISTMRSQLLSTGCEFDWDKEILTCESSYYRWTQWLFLKLYEHGFVKRQKIEVNFDPVDNTVLANEQIDSDGRSWRSGALAEKRVLMQWVIETTRYAKVLFDGLDQLPQWEHVADIQRGWIGNCDHHRFNIAIITYLTSARLQDWVVSRQRYWGTPIPMVHCAKCNEVPVPWDQLPVVLPEIATVSGSATLASATDWVNTFCPIIGLTNVKEPFERLLPQGIVRGKTLKCTTSGKYLRKEEVTANQGSLIETATGETVEQVYEKMSKSKHNGVDPMEILSRDGIDLTRLQLLENAPPKTTRNWDMEKDTRGLEKWFSRIFWCLNAFIDQRSKRVQSNSSELLCPKQNAFDDRYRESYNYFVRAVTGSLHYFQLHNTAISRLQGLTNALRKVNDDEFCHMQNSAHYERCLFALIVMLYPFAPNFSSELWAALRQCILQKSVTQTRSLVPWIDDEIWMQSWPLLDEDCELEFNIRLNDISLGRCKLPRKVAENVTVELALEIAVEKIKDAHRNFERVKSSGLEILDRKISHKPEFETILDLYVDKSADLSKILLERTAKSITKRELTLP